VPLMLHDSIANTTGNLNTYVQIRVPTVIGQDFVINNYTAPNVAPVGSPLPVAQTDADFRIHWVVYDHVSTPVLSGTCYVSSGDSVLWSTDLSLGTFQGQTYNSPVGAPGLNVSGKPIAYCGPASGEFLPAIGYVVFETWQGSDGLAADFAMEGSAWITDNNIALNVPALLSVPVVPMADGEDPADATDDTPPQLGINEVIITDTFGNKADGRPGDPTIVDPLAAGIRLNNGDGDNADPALISGGVQGSALNAPGNNGLGVGQGFSLHSIWLPTADETRSAFSLLWDEHENFCNQFIPLPYEVNLWAYNMQYQIPSSPLPPPNPWPIFTGTRTAANYALTDVTGALVATVNGQAFTSRNYCRPAAWNATVMGYAEYVIPEQGDVGAGTTSAGFAFEAQEATDGINDAWATHMMTANGRQ